MRISQVDPHLRALYCAREHRDWYPFVINGHYDEIETVSNWLNSEMEPSAYHDQTVMGGRKNGLEKFNLQLAFRQESDAVAFRLRWAGDADR